MAATKTVMWLSMKRGTFKHGNKLLLCDVGRIKRKPTLNKNQKSYDNQKGAQPNSGLEILVTSSEQ